MKKLLVFTLLIVIALPAFSATNKIQKNIETQSENTARKSSWKCLGCEQLESRIALQSLDYYKKNYFDIFPPSNLSWNYWVEKKKNPVTTEPYLLGKISEFSIFEILQSPCKTLFAGFPDGRVKPMSHMCDEESGRTTKSKLVNKDDQAFIVSSMYDGRYYHDEYIRFNSEGLPEFFDIYKETEAILMKLPATKYDTYGSFDWDNLSYIGSWWDKDLHWKPNDASVVGWFHVTFTIEKGHFVPLETNYGFYSD